VTGNRTDGVMDAGASVGTVAVGGRVTTVSTGTRIQVGYNTGARLGGLTAGTWVTSGLALTRIW